ncbi:MAG TPA: sulfatase [Nocardioidaceae bacterium]|nr:sulfatase [Nocardioidaceae bacterium]
MRFVRTLLGTVGGAAMLHPAKPVRALGAAALTVALAGSVLMGPTPQHAVAADTRPNIILISTDDMNKSDLRWMPKTRKLLANAGVTLDGFISNNPICCPARAEILTGQLSHNNGVHYNDGPWGGYKVLEEPGNHVGSWLKDAGYKTAFVGKHMNGWEETARRQRGWTIFNPIIKGIYKPYGLTMFNDGHPRRYRNIHSSDLVGKLTVNYINRFSDSKAPFFIWASQVAPHQVLIKGKWKPPVPAKRHSDLYPNAVPPSLSDPSFNEADVSDKPPYVQDSSMMSRRAVIRFHRARIRTLRSVDDQVGAAVRALRDAGEARNTYIFFTSDNGWLLGEHRLGAKRKPYEQSLQVPLVVKGPGLKAGTTRRQTFSLADLAPTFVQLADATPRRTLDGRSMLPTLRRGAPGYKHYLIHASSHSQEWWWQGVRSDSFVYIRYDDGFEELYDMQKDPAQLQNVADAPGYQAVRAEYAARLARLQDCSGEDCQSGGRVG